MPYLLSLFYFILFALTHSYWASDRFKRSLFLRFPEAKRFYRFSYSVSSVVILGLWYNSVPAVNYVYYELNGALYYFFRVIQLVGAIGLIHAVLISYPRVFIGLHQLFDSTASSYSLDEPENPEPLRITSVYKMVRHPMYFWSLVFLCFNPVMTDRHAFITLIFGLYFYLGSFAEEKKLENRYGFDYQNYKKNVPRLLPNPFLLSK